jgi:opacity protein-like surface antigen
MGYNVVWNRWLAGVQSEVSENFNATAMQGITSSNRLDTSQTVFPAGGVPSTFSSFQTSPPAEIRLANTWTISEMARLGYLVGDSWLVYGLLGWSIGGFEIKKEFDSRETPFTLSGITYGGGVEKDFGWLRAFIQVKAIDYEGKDITRSNNALNTSTTTSGARGFVTSSSNNLTTGADIRSISAKVTSVTAGITLPLNGWPPVAVGAAPLVVKGRLPAVPASRWDGLYASLSAGATSLRGDVHEPNLTSSSSTDNSFNTTGVLTAVDVDTSTNSSFDAGKGRDTGAVFTFAMGYNVVWNRWLAGIQSEISENLNGAALQGVSSRSESDTSQRVFPAGQTPTGFTFATAGPPLEFRLNNTWTVSEMARLGYLVGDSWLFYGLLGWSTGGFEIKKEFDSRPTPFTMNGITYGGGIEKDFGWLRAFVQVKAIDYGSKTLTRSNGATQVQNTTTGTGGHRRF